MDQARGDDPSLLFLAIPPPADFNVAWIETIHGADQEVVVLQALGLCRIHGHCGLRWERKGVGGVREEDRGRLLGWLPSGLQLQSQVRSQAGLPHSWPCGPQESA